MPMDRSRYISAEIPEVSELGRPDQPERDGLRTHAQDSQQQGTFRDEDLH